MSARELLVECREHISNPTILDEDERDRANIALLRKIDAYLSELVAMPEPPLAAIEATLGHAMDAAVRNGANSVSMPDEYVEVALWLSRIAIVSGK